MTGRRAPVTPIPIVEPDDLARFVNSHAPMPIDVAGADAVPPWIPDSMADVVSGCSSKHIAAAADHVWAIIKIAEPEQRASELNARLVQLRTLPVPQLREGNSALDWIWREPPTPHTGLRAACLLSMTDAVVELGWDRVGICHAADCVDIYFDSGKRAPRHYCGSLCLNRTRARTHRARKASQA